jgi:hypothetical protein
MRRILVAGLLLAMGAALAQEPVKIGVVGPFSGGAADYGKQMEAGMKAWMKIHGDSVNGRKLSSNRVAGVLEFSNANPCAPGARTRSYPRWMPVHQGCSGSR